MALVTGLVLPNMLETEASILFEKGFSFIRGYRPRTFDAAHFQQRDHRGVPVWQLGGSGNMRAASCSFAWGLLRETGRRTRRLQRRYRRSIAIETVVPVSSTEAAEMVKLLENTFRSVNIRLVNEVLLMCDKLKLDAWEVIEAAATKPFGYMKFTLGPGLGGHCIPIDPLYLSWKLKTLDYNARFIELASEVNTGMPCYWVQKVQDTLNRVAKPVKGSRVLVLGVAYKKDVSDLRESPALDILLLLREKGARVMYHDPHVPAFQHDGLEMTAVPDLEMALAEADCVVVATDHSVYDWATIRRRVQLIVDMQAATGRLNGQASLTGTKANGANVHVSQLKPNVVVG